MKSAVIITGFLLGILGAVWGAGYIFIDVIPRFYADDSSYRVLAELTTVLAGIVWYGVCAVSGFRIAEKL